jgi:flavin reductase (DIM6/NTAB) family NADH-FMN oxidoreductase RutF
VLKIGAQDSSPPGGATLRGDDASALIDAGEGANVPRLDPARFRSAMGKFATGVCVVSYVLEGKPAGLTANAFMSVSLDPPLVAVSVRNQSRLLTGVTVGDRYAVNVLACHQDQVSDHFAGRPNGAEPRAFQHRHGAPVIDDSLASIVARVVDLHPAGDHTLVIGQVEHLEERAAAPLIYFGGRYTRLDDVA